MYSPNLQLNLVDLPRVYWFYILFYIFLTNFKKTSTLKEEVKRIETCVRYVQGRTKFIVYDNLKFNVIL